MDFGLSRRDLHWQVRVHLATVKVDVNLLDELDDLLTAPAQDFSEHPQTQALEPARDILERKSSATQRKCIDLIDQPEDTSHRSASPASLSPKVQLATS